MRLALLIVALGVLGMVTAPTAAAHCQAGLHSCNPVNTCDDLVKNHVEDCTSSVTAEAEISDAILIL